MAGFDAKNIHWQAVAQNWRHATDRVNLVDKIRILVDTDASYRQATCEIQQKIFSHCQISVGNFPN